MPDNPVVFAIYPSSPPDVAETLRQVGATLATRGFTFSDWQDGSSSGQTVITSVRQQVLAADVVIADITYLNHNVLFEIGFAWASDKRVWLTLRDSSAGETEEVKRFDMLSNVTYTAYQNDQQIVTDFVQQKPHEHDGNILCSTEFADARQPGHGDHLLYLKSILESTASTKLSQLVDRQIGKKKVDDPSEIALRPLCWYIEQVGLASAVLVHNVSDHHTDARGFNGKNALVAGIAYGLGKDLLMLAHAPYETPVDYHDLLIVHSTAAECTDAAQRWLAGIGQRSAASAGQAREYARVHRAVSELQKLDLGDAVAEDEQEHLPEYYIPTAAYQEALRSRSAIFVGRKGSGKTANLYQLCHEIGANPRNHVCVIKPVGYELEGILDVLNKTVGTSQRGYLIESLWKLLVYTELCKSVYESLMERSGFPTLQAEKELVGFVEQHPAIVRPDFSVRLEQTVGDLQSLAPGTVAAQRGRISELLHQGTIARMRALLGEVLHGKPKVAVVIDNLDKAWRFENDLAALSDLLIGLMRVSDNISLDFAKEDSRRKSVNLSLSLFLRSDIFSYVLAHAREKDKIIPHRISWEDPELLAQVIEQRFIFRSPSVQAPEQVWQRYFCPTVAGMATRDYILAKTLPRPRDIIYFAQQALSAAINRKNPRIEENDVLTGEYEYSKYALGSLLPEADMPREQIESLLYEFAGGPKIVNLNMVKANMLRAQIRPTRHHKVLRTLCDLTFLGYETREMHYEFLYDEEDQTKYEAMAQKTAELHPHIGMKFYINPAFHSYLELQ